ncbi:MAG: hypothetical protein FRX49_10530 [Trebouxia sp. A1-2]|nr:MAG: hypothetical protein FRX49_10530 [Trebouxia sp. A1-2]
MAPDAKTGRVDMVDVALLGNTTMRVDKEDRKNRHGRHSSSGEHYKESRQGRHEGSSGEPYKITAAGSQIMHKGVWRARQDHHEADFWKDKTDVPDGAIRLQPSDPKEGHPTASHDEEALHKGYPSQGHLHRPRLWGQLHLYWVTPPGWGCLRGGAAPQLGLVCALPLVSCAQSANIHTYFTKRET